MKRRLLMMLLPVALCGCEPTQEQVKQNAASASLKLAQASLADASAGYNRSGSLPEGFNYSKLNDSSYEKVIGIDDKLSHADYRKAQLEKASGFLEALTRDTDPAHEMAALLTLGGINAAQARELVVVASSRWTSNTMRVHELTSLASLLREAKTAVDAYAKIDHSDLLATLKSGQTKSEQQVDTINKKISGLNADKKALETEIAERSTKQASYEKASGDAKRKAFTAKGQEAFELEKTAVVSLLKADEQSITIGQLNVKIDLINSHLKVETALLKQQQDNVANTVDAIKSLGDRTKSVSELAAASNKLLADRQKTFGTMFGAVAANQADVVEPAYAEVTKKFDTALSYLKRAVDKSDDLRDDKVHTGGAAEGKVSANFQIADVQAQKAHYLYQQHLVMTGYALFLTKLNTATAGGVIDSSISTQFAEIASKATTLATATKEEAIATVKLARDSYNKAAKEADDASSDLFKNEVKAEALARMGRAIDRLTMLTGQATPAPVTPPTTPDATPPTN